MPPRLPCPHDGCSKVLSRHDTLKNHLRTHTQEKPYKCPVQGCDTRFRRTNERLVHLREQHVNGELRKLERYSCICGQSFARKWARKRHTSTCLYALMMSRPRKEGGADHENAHADQLRANDTDGTGVQSGNDQTEHPPPILPSDRPKTPVEVQSVVPPRSPAYYLDIAARYTPGQRERQDSSPFKVGSPYRPEAQVSALRAIPASTHALGRDLSFQRQPRSPPTPKHSSRPASPVQSLGRTKPLPFPRDGPGSANEQDRSWWSYLPSFSPPARPSAPINLAPQINPFPMDWDPSVSAIRGDPVSTDCNGKAI